MQTILNTASFTRVEMSYVSSCRVYEPRKFCDVTILTTSFRSLFKWYPLFLYFSTHVGLFLNFEHPSENEMRGKCVFIIKKAVMCRTYCLLKGGRIGCDQEVIFLQYDKTGVAVLPD